MIFLNLKIIFREGSNINSGFKIIPENGSFLQFMA
jgi:hypothetical protein